MSDDDLIRRMDAVQACQVGTSDEWSRSTKDGYNQAATDCYMNILKIAPAAQPAVTVEEAARVLLRDLNSVKPVGMWGDAWPSINKNEGYAWNRMASALRALAGDKP